MGPLINRKQLDHVQRLLAQGYADGLKVAALGRLHPQAIASGFYQPAVLWRDVPHDHPLVQKEIFGPVLVAMPFDHEDEAIELANGT